MTELREHWTKAGPVETREERSTLLAEEARSKMRTGEAIPLGLVGFATATFAAGTVIAGWWPQASMALVIPVLLIFGGIAQFVAAMWSYANADTLSATAFGAFGAFNVTFSIFFLMQHSGALGPAVSFGPLAVWIACFAFIAFFLSLAALARSTGLFAVLLSLAVGYAMLSAGYFAMQPGNTTTIAYVGGWFLIVSATLAFYNAAAVTLNSSFQRTVLPIGSPHELRRSRDLVGQRG